MKKIYLVVGKSGSGKTTLVNEMCNLFPQRHSIESYTTRPRRVPSESGHVFVSDEEFDHLKDLVAYTEFDGYRYAATTQQVEENDFYVIDPAGVRFFLDHYKGNKTPVLIYVYCPAWTRFTRMKERDGWQTALRRVWHDHFAFKCLKGVLKNTDVEFGAVANLDGGYYAAVGQFIGAMGGVSNEIQNKKRLH